LELTKTGGLHPSGLPTQKKWITYSKEMENGLKSWLPGKADFHNLGERLRMILRFLFR
jgi:hypothetical protein